MDRATVEAGLVSALALRISQVEQGRRGEPVPAPLSEPTMVALRRVDPALADLLERDPGLVRLREADPGPRPEDPTYVGLVDEDRRLLLELNLVRKVDLLEVVYRLSSLDSQQFPLGNGEVNAFVQWARNELLRRGVLVEWDTARLLYVVRETRLNGIWSRRRSP